MLNDPESIATLVRELTHSPIFDEALSITAEHCRTVFRDWGVESHIELINMLPDGFERISLAVLYYEAGKSLSFPRLEFWMHFIITHRESKSISIKEYEHFCCTGCGEFYAWLAEESAIADTAKIREITAKKLRLEYFKLAHDIISEYLKVIRETRLKIASLLLPTLSNIFKTNTEHAEDRMEIERQHPDFITSIDNVEDGFQQFVNNQLTEGLRAYLEREATSESQALSLANQQDQDFIELRIPYLLTQNKSLEAWQLLQMHRSRILCSQILMPSVHQGHMLNTSQDTNLVDQRTSERSSKWIHHFRNPNEDDFDQFQTWMQFVASINNKSNLNEKHHIQGGNIDHQMIMRFLDQQDHLPGETAIVELLTTERETYVFVFRKSMTTPEVVKVPITKTEIEKVTRDLVLGYSRLRWGLFEQGKPPLNEYDRSIQLLSALKPLTAWMFPILDGVTRLCIIPYDLSHFLPFSILPSPINRSRYLIEEFSLSYLPTIQLLPAVSASNPRRKDVDSGRYTKALIAGTEYDSEVQGPLNEHIARISTWFSYCKIYKGVAATPLTVSVVDPDEQWDIFYLHGHGQIDSADAGNNGVLLSNGSRFPLPTDRGDTFVLTSRQIATSALNGDLAVIASCLSARGDINPGEEIVGLVRSLLLCRFSSILTALWSFQKESGRILFETFAKSWAGDQLAKSDALAYCQRQMLQGALGKEYQHPYYWGPFTLTGDWL